jgi:hypothetical protein
MSNLGQLGDSRLRVEQRPHDGYAAPLDGGYRGYQARCWDCDWTGPEHLRGDEPMGTEASRTHKRSAQLEAAAHSADLVDCCSRCKRALNDDEDGCR